MASEHHEGLPPWPFTDAERGLRGLLLRDALRAELRLYVRVGLLEPLRTSPRSVRMATRSPWHPLRRCSPPDRRSDRAEALANDARQPVDIAVALLDGKLPDDDLQQRKALDGEVDALRHLGFEPDGAFARRASARRTTVPGDRTVGRRSLALCGSDSRSCFCPGSRVFLHWFAGGGDGPSAKGRKTRKFLPFRTALVCSWWCTASAARVLERSTDFRRRCARRAASARDCV